MKRQTSCSSKILRAAPFGLILLMLGCIVAPTVPPIAFSTPTIVPTSPPILNSTATIAATHTLIPTYVPSSTATLVPNPAITLKPGDFYFSTDERQSIIFSRNIAGYQQNDYETIFQWTKGAGSKFIRVQLDNLGGIGFTSAGKIDPTWLYQWDRIFDKAEAEGIYLLPVFSTWHDWNNGSPDMGYSTWKNNQVNQANGGKVQTPAEMFQKGSATQSMWMDWMQALVDHWRGHKNILAWEVFSEVNLATGSSETTGVEFVNTAVKLIRQTDPGRLVTASIADCPPEVNLCYWPNFYSSVNIDFVELHPYHPQLDRVLIGEVSKSLGKNRKPVLIGESGLSAATPDGEAGKLTVATNAPIGVRHAIWASIVSGAMNGRNLWWEDGYGIYFPNLGLPWIQKYQNEERLAVNFVKDVDFAGYKPLATATSPEIWGASVGNETSIIGWFRDAACEPPNWNLKPILSKQTVTLTVPGLAANWKIDFYNTKTGTDIVSSARVAREGMKITIVLPDFTDDIAFKMIVQK